MSFNITENYTFYDVLILHIASFSAIISSQLQSFIQERTLLKLINMLRVKSLQDRGCKRSVHML